MFQRLFGRERQRQPRDHGGALRHNRGGRAATVVLFGLECARHAARPLRDAVAAHVPVPAPPARRNRRARPSIAQDADRRVLPGCRSFAAGTRHRRCRRAETHEEAGADVLRPHRRLWRRARCAATRMRWPPRLRATSGPTAASWPEAGELAAYVVSARCAACCTGLPTAIRGGQPFFPASVRWTAADARSDRARARFPSGSTWLGCRKRACRWSSTPTEEQRRRLAAAHDLLAGRPPQGGAAGHAVEAQRRKVSGKVEADITQECVVTLEP